MNIIYILGVMDLSKLFMNIVYISWVVNLWMLMSTKFIDDGIKDYNVTSYT